MPIRKEILERKFTKQEWREFMTNAYDFYNSRNVRITYADEYIDVNSICLKGVVKKCQQK
jgi:hypothetical protein